MLQVPKLLHYYNNQRTNYTTKIKSWINEEYYPYYSLTHIVNINDYCSSTQLRDRIVGFPIKDRGSKFEEVYNYIWNNFEDLTYWNKERIQSSYFLEYLLFKLGIFNYPQTDLLVSSNNFSSSSYSQPIFYKVLKNLSLFDSYPKSSVKTIIPRVATGFQNLYFEHGFCGGKDLQGVDRIFWILVFKQEYFEYIRLAQLIGSLYNNFNNAFLQYHDKNTKRYEILTKFFEEIKDLKIDTDIFELWVNTDFDKNKGICPKVRTVYRKNVVSQANQYNIPIIRKSEQEINDCFFKLSVHKEKTIKKQKEYYNKVSEYFAFNHNNNPIKLEKIKDNYVSDLTWVNNDNSFEDIEAF